MSLWSINDMTAITTTLQGECREGAQAGIQTTEMKQERSVSDSNTARLDDLTTMYMHSLWKHDYIIVLLHFQ